MVARSSRQRRRIELSGTNSLLDLVVGEVVSSEGEGRGTECDGSGAQSESSRQCHYTSDAGVVRSADVSVDVGVVEHVLSDAVGLDPGAEAGTTVVAAELGRRVRSSVLGLVPGVRVDAAVEERGEGGRLGQGKAVSRADGRSEGLDSGARNVRPGRAPIELSQVAGLAPIQADLATGLGCRGVSSSQEVEPMADGVISLGGDTCGKCKSVIVERLNARAHRSTIVRNNGGGGSTCCVLVAYISHRSIGGACGVSPNHRSSNFISIG
jgi:hypothetical protein